MTLSIAPTSFTIKPKALRFGDSTKNNPEKSQLQCCQSHQSPKPVDAKRYLTPEEIELDKQYAAKGSFTRLKETGISRFLELAKALTLVLYPSAVKGLYYQAKGASLTLVKRYANAEKAFRKALEIEKGKRFKDCTAIYLILGGLAKACEKQGKTEEAQVIRSRKSNYNTL